MTTISEQLKIIPELSGSYQFYDKDNTIIYVGKAKNLKRRVNSYFVNSNSSPKVSVMVPQIKKIEFIITNSEIEALILESHLIKKYKPKYNVLLKDDKKFPYFVITDEDYPRILVVRKRNKNPVKGKYFGPYTNAKAMYSTLDLLKKMFPLKQCKTPKFKDRPCLYYSMGRCLAPCQKMVTSNEYKKIIKNVELFLSGKQLELIKRLKEQMQKYSDNEEYEKAAKFRDSYLDIERTLERQQVVFENTNVNIDIITPFMESGVAVVVLLQIRQGKLTNKKDFEYNFSNINSKEDILLSFLREYYEITTKDEFPKEIVISENLTNDDIKLYSNWLSEKAGKKVKISGEKSKRNEELLYLAQKNAVYFLEKVKLQKISEIQNDYNEIGSYIQEKLHLTKFPHRAECFDISHIQGTNTVASMVVFKDGMPLKSEYKKFKIKSTESKPDDFMSLKEATKRRYSKNPVPDLIIIDGGKGQLSSVLEVFDELNITDLNIVSLAKREEEVFLPHKSKSIIFPINSGAMYFFQRIRDEAHRFAINYHRKLRENQATKSVLDDIKGLSEKSKKLLYKHFGEIKNIAEADLEKLEKIIPRRTAKIVYRFFRENKK